MLFRSCTNDKRDFAFYHDFPTPGRAHLAGKSQSIPILGHGVVVLRTRVNDQDRTLILNNVLYIPDASERFFAPRVPLSCGHTIVMNSDSLTLRKKGTGEALFEAHYDPLTHLY